MSNPDQIRHDIERTRAELSDDVNALAENASPKNIAQTQVDKAKESVADKVTEVKERIFGSEDDYYDDGLVGDAADRVEDARYRAADAVDNVRQNLSDAPRAVKRNTRGNPLAAGLVAFGAGALLGSMMPATRTEKRYVEQAKEQAQPYVEQAKDIAKDAASALQAPAQEAVAAVKQTAKEAADNVKEEAAFAKDDVVEQAKFSQQDVAEQAKGAKDRVADK